jgi:ADP-heptose:LPS heptosyltransferase
MADVARHFLSEGLRVAVFGKYEDDIASIPGERPQPARIELLPDLLAGCRVIVGTDSGPTHLASSLGIPTVIIFTATSEIKGDPVGMPNRKVVNTIPCRPCQSKPQWFGCKDWKCREIQKETVIQSVMEIMK